MRFSIVIPTYKHLDDCLRPCLESIKTHTDLSDTEVIVVANGCGDDGTREYVKSLGEPFKLVWLDEPSGYTHSTNVGIEAASGDYIILLNNDCVILGAEWISLLYQPFRDDPLMGITGPLKLHCPDADRDFLVFFCAMISRKLLDTIGTLDEVFSPGYGEDCDLAARAIDAGWKIQQVPESEPQLVDKGCEDLPQWKRDKMWHNPFPLYHDGNKTFGDEPEKFDEILRRNKLTLQERYRDKVNTPTANCKCGKPKLDGVCVDCLKVDEGIDIFEASVTDGWFGVDECAQLARWVKDLPPNSVVVEVGSWHGRSSRAIAANLSKGSRLYCVDTFNGSSGEPEMHGTAHWDRGDHAFQWWLCNLWKYVDAGQVIPIRAHSENAAHTLNHLGLKIDLLFIDADHSLEGFKTDAHKWSPLMKDGALWCGHDYYPEGEEPFAWIGVRQGVQELFPDAQKVATSLWWSRSRPIVPRGKVYDCFIASNELDLIEMRLHTLDDVVDRFVICEGTKYHNGEPKPLFFNESRERFAPFLHKIIHVVVDDWPEASGSIYDNAWMCERYQRDAIMRGLTDCKDEDIIILGDADEITNPEAVKNYQVSQGLCRLKQRMFYYYLNCENKEGWDWHKIAPYKTVKELTPCGVRYPPAGDTPLIENGGWHFSFLSSPEGIADKLRTYSHQEFNTPEITNTARIQSLMERGQDLFDRPLKYEFVEIDESYPQYIRNRVAELTANGLIKTAIKTDVSLAAKKHWTVTAEVSTKDRYFTTLPLTISAIANQTRKVDKLVIYDDGEQLDLRMISPFNGLLKMLDELKIEWEIIRTPRQGQVSNHQHCLETATSDFIWRVDDDEIPAPDCLNVLLNTIRDYGDGGQFENIGAVAGLLHHPGSVDILPSFVDGSMQDAQAGLHIQWYEWNSYPKEVEHLTSTFLYRVEAGRNAGGYPKGLSVVGHREETIFSHSIKRAGYKLLVTPYARTWHLREPSGGIRSFSDGSLWEHDEKIFQSYLNEWGATGRATKLIVLDCGIGDHFAFKSALPKIREAHKDKDLVLAVCYPSVFAGEDVNLISIADAKNMLGERYEDYSIYKHLWDKDWKGSLSEGMVEMHG